MPPQAYEVEQLQPTSAELYFAAFFLSQFSVQDWRTFDSETASDYELARLASIFAVIHFPDLIGSSGGYRTLSLTNANLMIDDYTTRHLNPQTGVLYDDGAGHVWKYENDKICFPKSEGERYNHFVFVKEIWRMSDGTKKLVFDIYELSASEYDKNGLSESLFWLDTASVKNLTGNGTIRKIGSGTAITLPNDTESYDYYRMVHYEASF